MMPGIALLMPLHILKDVTLVRPQDAGANTCGHILSQLPHLQLPTLEKLGLINALGYAPGDMQPSDSATWGASFGVPLRLLGLYDGLLAIASTSPVLTSTSTALPDSALLKATALFSSR